jgi:hypothetical protein
MKLLLSKVEDLVQVMEERLNQSVPLLNVAQDVQPHANPHVEASTGGTAGIIGFPKASNYRDALNIYQFGKPGYLSKGLKDLSDDEKRALSRVKNNLRSTISNYKCLYDEFDRLGKSFESFEEKHGNDGLQMTNLLRSIRASKNQE